MQSITNSRVRKQGKRELRAVFKALRFKDGLTIGSEETAPTTDDFIYYYNKARDGQVGNYIIYEVIASDPSRRAEDKIIGREFYAQLDIFSTSSFESKLLTETLDKLEEKLTESGFIVDAREEDFEEDTRLYHQIFYVSKLYF